MVYNKLRDRLVVGSAMGLLVIYLAISWCINTTAIHSFKDWLMYVSEPAVVWFGYTGLMGANFLLFKFMFDESKRFVIAMLSMFGACIVIKLVLADAPIRDFHAFQEYVINPAIVWWLGIALTLITCLVLYQVYTELFE